MPASLGPEEANQFGLKTAEKLGADEAILFTVVSNERMARFANSSMTVTKNVNESGQIVYLAKGGRRIIGSSSNPQKTSLDRFISLLYKSMMTLPKDPAYVPLPPDGRVYNPKPSYDKRLESAEELLAGYVSEAIGSAEEAGARRTAGSIESDVTSHHILTSTGASGTDTGSKILLNIRAFVAKEASGHGLSCSATAGDFHPGKAGAVAGGHARRMKDAKQPAEEGKYQVLMSPTVAANLLGLVGEFASAFAIEAGTSYLVDKLGKKVAADRVTVVDHGKTDGCLEARNFDDEGQPTHSTKIIEEGVLRNYLHNVSTAKRFKAKTTGNAGLIEPGPWNLEVGAGDSTYDEMVKEMRHGVILTSNWVQWWEVETPTLCPWVLVDGVTITKAYGDTPSQAA